MTKQTMTLRLEAVGGQISGRHEGIQSGARMRMAAL